MKFVIDTGAFLSLACSHHYTLVQKEYTLLTTPQVIEELKHFTVYDDFLGEKAQQVLASKYYLKKSNLILSLQIEPAENSVFSLAEQEHCLAITDDLHAARIAWEKKRLLSRPSFYVLLLLYKKKRITKEQLQDDIGAITLKRNWLNSALWDYAMTLIEKL